MINDALTEERFLDAKANFELNNDNVKPLHHNTFPTRAYKDRAQKLIDELLESGVIVEESQPSKWCAEGKFDEKESCEWCNKVKASCGFQKVK
mgnify:CR=1 FL=1